MATDMNEDAITATGHPVPLATGHPASPSGAPAARRGLPAAAWIALAVVAAIAIAAVVIGLLERASAEHTLTRQTDAAAIQTVSITYPTGARLTPDVALPGNVQAFTDTPIYARTSGYLRRWYFDIGAHVRKGQLLAQIESPEVDQQLQQAQANLKSAQANLQLANTTRTRYVDLLKSNSVSKQETDQAVSGAAAQEAGVDAAMANVRRLEQLQGFENVYAPFDGIVTARNTDIGALIDAGSAGAAPKELFHMAAVGRMRVYVPVPEVYSSDVVDGGKAFLTLDEYPGRQFDGTIARNSNAIDPATRTLNVEIDVPNPKGELLPGAYVFVHFHVAGNHTPTVTIPSNALLFRSEGLRVGVVRDGKVHLQPVTITHDEGAVVEIGSGLQPSDSVILDPSDSLAEGQQVHVATKSGAAASGAGQ